MMAPSRFGSTSKRRQWSIACMPRVDASRKFGSWLQHFGEYPPCPVCELQDHDRFRMRLFRSLARPASTTSVNLSADFFAISRNRCRERWSLMQSCMALTVFRQIAKSGRKLTYLQIHHHNDISVAEFSVYARPESGSDENINVDAAMEDLRGGSGFRGYGCIQAPSRTATKLQAPTIFEIRSARFA